MQELFERFPPFLGGAAAEKLGVPSVEGGVVLKPATGGGRRGGDALGQKPLRGEQALLGEV